MAIRIIDEFKVKPTGFLASWRYARVLIDDKTYVITQGNVPGKEAINLPNISDYNKVSRRYANGAKITEFFNVNTNQKITVYAQNSTPFANAVVITQAPPLPPTPPPNPFGTATYGTYLIHRFADIDNRIIKLQVDKRGWTGATTTVLNGGGSSITLSKKPLSEIVDFIHSLECTINLISETEFFFGGLFTDDGRMFKCTVTYENTGDVIFKGFVEPHSAREPFVAAPYGVSFRAVDGLGALDGITYPIPAGGRTNMRQTWVSILQYCFSKTDLELPFYTMNNLYEAKMLNGLDDDPMLQSKVNPLRFSDDKGNIMTCLEVLQNVCRQFTGYITQSEGCWHFVRVPELANPVVRRRKYQANGLFLFGEQVNNLMQLGHEEEVELLSDAEFEIHNAYKRVTALHKFGWVPSVIFNGDFESWDGTNFEYWTKFGGIDVSRVQNSIPGVGGTPILINDHSMQFNARYDLSKWMQPNNIRVVAGDKLSLSFNVGSNSPKTVIDYVYLRISLDDGAGNVYWLSRPSAAVVGGQLKAVEPVWVLNSLQTYDAQMGMGPKQTSSFIFTINIPVTPVSGDVTIQFFGFKKIDTTIKRLSGDNEYIYSAMQIDNISMAVTNVGNNAIPDGVLYTSEQAKFYTESPDMITLLFGDNVDLYQTTNVTSNASNVLINNISSIYTSDGSYSTLWYEYGLSTLQLPIVNWTAKAMLKLYQSPFRIFSAGAKGVFNGLTVFNICLLEDQVYAIQSGEFDLRMKQFNRMVLVQLFYKNIPTNNFGIPHTVMQMGLPPIFNNPNQPVPVAGVRIFTNQFTEQFT